MQKYPVMERTCRKYLREHPEANGVKREKKQGLFSKAFGESVLEDKEKKPVFEDKEKEQARNEKWYVAVNGDGFPEVSEMGQVFLYTEGRPGLGKVTDIEDLIVTAAMKGATRVYIDFMRPGMKNVPIAEFIAERNFSSGSGRWKQLEVL